MYNIISLHDGADKWSKQYPLGIPSFDQIFGDASESGEGDDGEFTDIYDAVDEGEDDAEGLDEHLTYVALEDDDGFFDGFFDGCA
ncbi:hypothetical protein PG988_002428 [Apiospora saccharicola]